MTDVLATFAGYSAGARYNGAGMSIASTGRGNDHMKPDQSVTGNAGQY